MATRKSPRSGEARAKKFGIESQSTPITIAEKHRKPQPEIPGKAALARRFPRLRVNRLSGRWRDEATGERGDDFASLATFISGGRR